MVQRKELWGVSGYLRIVAAMTLMGGFYWAIRGSGGYGGETGGMLAGFGWALLWYAFSQCGADAARRPYNSPWMLVAITLGIAFGGFTGYGVYIGWLDNRFYLNYPEGLRHVSAWTGYAMLFLCGLHWGGNVGCVMAWCAPRRPVSGRDWAVRIACGMAGAAGAWLFVHFFPQFFLPFYGEGLYSVPENATCRRALDSMYTIAPHVGLVFGFLAFELVRGDRRAAAMIVTMALGFAIPFTAGGYWQTAPFPAFKIDWWKCWEMSIGLGGGLAFGLAFWLFNQPGEAQPVIPGPKARAFFRSGIFLAFAALNVLQGAYDGWSGIHGMAPSGAGYLVLIAACLIPVFAAWYWRKNHETDETRLAPYMMSLRTILALQALIIVCGFLVSIPRQWAFANQFLVCLYLIYIGISALAAGTLFLKKM